MFPPVGSRAAFRRALQANTVGRGSFIRPLINVTPTEAAHLLEGLVSVNVHQISQTAGASLAGAGARGYFPILRGIQATEKALREGKPLPRGAVRYDPYDPDEWWQTHSELLGQIKAKGFATGDCEDLSSAVVAELRYAGLPAKTYVYQSGPGLFHVVAQTPWGVLDPSLAAGMSH